MHFTIKTILLAVSLPLFGTELYAQAGGDPGVGTIGNFEAPRHDSASTYKHELDLLFAYGTSAGGLKYYQPQLNYRAFGTKGGFFELRVPVNTSKDDASGTSVTGVGDILATYNNGLHIGGARFRYSVGLRVSVSNADKSDGITSSSHPMYLQPGLGTTDLMVAASYDFCKYLSLGAGVQVPFIQYNKNVDALYAGGAYSSQLVDFRRQPDAMLKLLGHFGTGKLKVKAGVTAIFHLSDDYYNTATSTEGKYYLVNSNGTNLNGHLELGYNVSKRFVLSLLYAKSFISTDLNADGLARNMAIVPKLTCAF